MAASIRAAARYAIDNHPVIVLRGECAAARLAAHHVACLHHLSYIVINVHTHVYHVCLCGRESPGSPLMMRTPSAGW